MPSPPHAAAAAAPPPPAIAHSNSFLEKIQSISIEPTKQDDDVVVDYERNDDINQVLLPYSIVPPPQLPRRHHHNSLDNETLLLAPVPPPPPIPYVDADSRQPVLEDDVDEDDMMMMIHDDDPMESAAAAPEPPPHAILRQSSSGRRRLIRRRRRRRRMKKEGAAVEWIQELQHQSLLGSSSSDGRGKRIAESASSKFLTSSSSGIMLDPASMMSPTTLLPAAVGGVFVGYNNNNISINDNDDDGDGGRGDGVAAPSTFSSLFVGGGSGQTHTVGMTPEDVVRALGMPHPLCRSSTIETGPFTVAMLKAGGVGAVDGGGVRSSENNSIALTSSGSGD